VLSSKNKFRKKVRNNIVFMKFLVRRVLLAVLGEVLPSGSLVPFILTHPVEIYIQNLVKAWYFEDKCSKHVLHGSDGSLLELQKL
jgi:hypothetical protein